MGDEPSNKGIPSWQLNSNKSLQSDQEPSAAQSQNDKASDQQPTSDFKPSSESVIEQARRFLDDESLIDASLQEKIAFLQTKGLSSSEIDQAIQQSKVKPSSTTTTSMISTSSDQNEVNEKSVQNVPPIITYPEFLMQAQKPPPIFTISRLLNTAYAAAGIGAAIYGMSKYLVTPMTDSLTSSRHDFAMHVQSQLDELNEKLREVVSTDVHRNLPLSSSTITTNDVASEDGSSHSDPTELFHRDFGTQTSSNLASSSSTSLSEDSSDTPSDALEEQTHKLSEISNGLTALLNDEAVGGGSSAELSTAIKVLDDYLESLAYPAFSNEMNPYSVSYGTENDKAKKQEDEIHRMKAEIRSVKGVLLSARNFPGSTSVRRPLYPPTT